MNTPKPLDSLKRSIVKWTEESNKFETPIAGLSLFTAKTPSPKAGGLYDLSICMVVQGAKQVMLGNDILVYDAEHYLFTSVDLPTIVQIIEASPDKPYLGLKLALDLRELSQLMVDGNLPAPGSKKISRGMATGKLTTPLLNSFKRLVDLLDTPDDIPILAPLIKREICYRLLVGEEGGYLRQIAASGSPSRQIAQAITWLRKNYSQPLRIEELATLVNMSKSAFHNHFRELTAMSPLQYQKALRLNEARRLMLAERADASTAAFNVGYESTSQFSREYSRHFGAPPLRDIAALREIAENN